MIKLALFISVLINGICYLVTGNNKAENIFLTFIICDSIAIMICQCIDYYKKPGSTS